MNKNPIPFCFIPILLLLARPLHAVVDVDDFKARIFVRSGFSFNLPYRLFIPEGYDGSRQYPLILYLHGGAGCGSDNYKNVENGAKIWAEPENQAVHPCFVVAPQINGTLDWDSDAEKMTLFLVDSLKNEFHIDEDRIYLTGVSLGGMGTLEFIIDRPDKFAAAVPVSGMVAGTHTTLDAPAIKHVPIWMFHGETDCVIPVEHARKMFRALKEAGAGNLIYTEFIGYGHDIAGMAYRCPDLSTWIFAQRKGGHRSPPGPVHPAETFAGEREIRLAWDRAPGGSDPDDAIWFYAIYRDGVKMDTTQTTYYYDRGLSDATLFTYEIKAVNYSFIESQNNPVVSVRTLSDAGPPEISSVHVIENSADQTKVQVEFNESMDSASVTDVDHYRLEPPIRIHSAEFGWCRSSVILTASPLEAETPYALIVNRVKDGSRSVNPIKPDSRFSFRLDEWMWNDIGPHDAPGTVSVNEGKASISGATKDVNGASDAFTYAYKTVQGDFSMVLKITSLQSRHPESKAGLMIRETIDPRSRHISLFVCRSSKLILKIRTADGGNTINWTFDESVSFPVFFKFERVGNKISLYKSSDGTDWVSLLKGFKTNMENGLKAGFGLASFDPFDQSTAHYENIKVTQAEPSGIGESVQASPIDPVKIVSAFPNPFNGRVRIRYDVDCMETKNSGLLIIQIYDILGRKIATLADKDMEAGRHETVWDGKDVNGKTVPSGMYLCRFETMGGYKTLKLLMTK